MPDPDQIVAGLLITLPNLESGTLKSRTAGDAGFDDSTWTVRRKPADAEMVAAAELEVGKETANFEFFKTPGQSVEPRARDKFTDALGVTWTLISAKVKHRRRIFDYLCLRDL